MNSFMVFTDDEILGELARRDRLVRVYSEEHVDAGVLHRYEDEPGFMEHVQRSIAKSIGRALHADKMLAWTAFKSPGHNMTHTQRAELLVIKP